MKSLICIVILLSVSFLNMAQKSEKARIAEIEQEIPKAVDKGNYERAASLKKEKETLEEIVVALENGDYEKAANLKEGLENGSSGSSVASTKSRLSEVEEEISKAVDDGDYEKAAELKKEKELLEELIVAQENGDSEKVDELQAKLSDGGSASGASNKEISPEFVNQVYMWDKSNNELERLEKQKGTLETSTSAAPFYAKSTSFYKVDGEYSSVRKDNDHSFVIKVMGGQDPRDLVELVIFKPGKDGKDRYMPYYEASGYAYGGSSGEVKDVKIPISIKKVKDQVYEIIPDESLKNGEYGYKVIDKFYCFGVGPKGAESKDQGDATPPAPVERREANRNKLTKNGYYLDFMLGTGSTSENFFGNSFVTGFRMGNKFYSKNDSKFKPGFSLNYARLQGGIDPGDDFYYMNFSPIGVGFASITQFSENTGLELNLDAMLNIYSSLDVFAVMLGVLVSPNVKYRYKSFAIGVDLGLTTGRDVEGIEDDPITSSTFSLTIGGKF